MPRQQEDALDRERGVLPEITRDPRGVTYVMTLTGARHHDHVIIRCDDHGEVWMSTVAHRVPDVE